MYSEISRTPIPNNEGAFIVQRLKNNAVETLKETTHNSGEVVDPKNETITVETIKITRQIGLKTEF